MAKKERGKEGEKRGKRRGKKVTPNKQQNAF